MKRYLLLVPVLGVLAFCSPAVGAEIAIPVLNAQFNIDTLSCAPGSNCYSFAMTGWLVGPQSGFSKLSTEQFPSAPATGLYVAFLGYPPATGSILQTLGAALRANTTYTLKVNLGARADFPFTGYVAALMAGNVVLAFDDSVSPAPGTFLTDVIVFNSGPSPALLNQPLQILIKSVGSGQLSVDRVSLTASEN